MLSPQPILVWTATIWLCCGLVGAACRRTPEPNSDADMYRPQAGQALQATPEHGFEGHLDRLERQLMGKNEHGDNDAAGSRSEKISVAKVRAEVSELHRRWQHHARHIDERLQALDRHLRSLRQD